MAHQPKPSRSDGDDRIEQLVRLAALLGMNTVRTRWKLMALEKRYQGWRLRAARQAEHVRYAHKVCRRCGQVADRDERRCPSCEAPMGSWAGHVLERIGLAGFSFGAGTFTLALLIVAAYARVLVGAPGEGLSSFSSEVLIRFGANHGPSVWAGQWWRLGTSIFLHIGLLHLAFNLIALAQIGPAIEEIHGRGRTALLFMATGVAASLGSALYHENTVSAGASGALTGLMGVAIGWGFRDGTTVARELRGRMLKWALYTMVFGVLVHADNAAHAVGLGAGLACGLVLRPLRARGASAGRWDTVEGGIGMVATLACVVLVMRPPAPIDGALYRKNATSTSIPSLRAHVLRPGIPRLAPVLVHHPHRDAVLPGGGAAPCAPGPPARRRGNGASGRAPSTRRART